MSKETDKALREQINATVNAIQEAGFKAPTERAYIFNRLTGLVYTPDSKRAGQIRSLSQTNRVRVKQGLEPLTASEYRLELKALESNPQLSTQGIRDYHFKQITEYLYKGEPLTDEQKQIAYEKISKMSDKELSALIKSYSSDKADPYTNAHQWISDNVLGDKDK